MKLFRIVLNNIKIYSLQFILLIFVLERSLMIACIDLFILVSIAGITFIAFLPGIFYYCYHNINLLLPLYWTKIMINNNIYYFPYYHSFNTHSPWPCKQQQQQQIVLAYYWFIFLVCLYLLSLLLLVLFLFFIACVFHKYVVNFFLYWLAKLQEKKTQR